MLLSIIVFMAVGFIDPSPIDGFYANLMSTKAEVNFEVTVYDYNGSIKDFEKTVRAMKSLEMSSSPLFVLDGKWRFDGKTTEYIQQTIAGELFDKSSSSGIAIDSAFYTNEKIGVLQYINNKRLIEPIMVINTTDKYPVPCYGPWTFGSFQRFGSDLTLFTNESSKKTFSISYNNRPMKIETYKKKIADMTLLKKVIYNPEEDFNPVFIRSITLAKDSSNIQDIYVIASVRCKDGGYYPIEWMKVSYSSDEKNIPLTEDSDAGIITWKGKPTLTKFKAKSWRDLTSPISVQVFSKSNLISSPNGFSKLNATENQTISFSQIDSLMQNPQVRTTKVKLKQDSNSSFVEPTDINTKSKSRVLTLFNIFLTLSFFLISFISYKKLKHFVLFLTSLFILNGCTNQSSQLSNEPALSVRFQNNTIITKPSQESTSVNLILKNNSLKPLEVYAIDAGCSCRQIDDKSLPVSIKPNQESQILMHVFPKSKFEPIQFLLNISTDIGVLKSRAQIELIPSNSFDPETIHISTLYDVSNIDDSSFLFVHRTLVSENIKTDSPAIRFNSKIDIKKVRTEIKPIGYYNSFTFNETTYEGKIISRDLGLFKEVIEFQNPDNSVLALPVVWQRKPFVSFTPAKIYLNKNKARAFINSPDESIEIQKIISHPKSVQVTIVSPKEIAIELTDFSKSSFEGEILVQTNSKIYSSVRLNVVNYSK